MAKNMVDDSNQHMFPYFFIGVILQCTRCGGIEVHIYIYWGFWIVIWEGSFDSYANLLSPLLIDLVLVTQPVLLLPAC